MKKGEVEVRHVKLGEFGNRHLSASIVPNGDVTIYEAYAIDGKIEFRVQMNILPEAVPQLLRVIESFGYKAAKTPCK